MTRMGAQARPTGTSPWSMGLKAFLLPGFDTLGRVSGVVALVISLIHPTIEGWHDIMRAPATIATNRGSPLELAYDPQMRALEFRVSAILRNDGTRDDALQAVSVRLQALASGTGHALPDEGIGVASEEEESVILPYPVRLGSHRLGIQARSPLDPTDLAAFHAEGEWQLVVTLKAEDSTPHTLEYCFYLTSTTIKDLFDSERLQEKRFIRSTCE